MICFIQGHFKQLCLRRSVCYGDYWIMHRRGCAAAQYEITSHSCNFLKGLKRTTKILSQDRRRPGRISKGYFPNSRSKFFRFLRRTRVKEIWHFMPQIKVALQVSCLFSSWNTVRSESRFTWATIRSFVCQCIVIVHTRLTFWYQNLAFKF
jgi:hypothetical protein